VSFGIYEAKRLLRTPLIWYSRRKHADEPDEVKWRLEHNAYRKASFQLMGAQAVDPHYLHRADLDADAVVIDIGAFRGIVAEEFLELYGCRIHAYEPNPQFFDDLDGRFAEEPRVTVHRYGLGGADATLQMEQRGLGSTVYGTNDDATVPTVDVKIRDIAGELDELGLDRLDYVKINIEGAEYDLLERMLDTGWVERTRYLLIQFHEWYPSPHLRRWKIRRRLRATHDQVWNYPWIYELWCSKDQPPPPVPHYSEEELVVIRAALREQRLAREGGGAPTGAEQAGPAPDQPST
jgi:FkbM family methyltransferase